MTGASKGLQNWSPAALVALLVGFVFLDVLGADFVMWDDDVAIYRNPHLTGLSWETIVWSVTDTLSTMRYVPLSLLVWNLIYEFVGLNPFGYHFANFILHLASAALLFILIRTILEISAPGRSRQPDKLATETNVSAFLATLFWAVNPLRVEPVAWATDLPYGLATTLLLCSAIFYLRAATSMEDKSAYRKNLLLSVLTHLASLLAHPIGLTCFLVLPLLDHFLLGRTRRARSGNGISLRGLFLEKAAFALPAIMLGSATVLLRLLSENPLYRPRSLETVNYLEQLFQTTHALVYYTWRSFAPFNLSPVYVTYWEIDPLSPRFLGSLAIFALAVLAIVMTRRKIPALFAIMLAFVILSLPVIGFLEPKFIHSDRYAHLMTIPLAAGLGLLILNLKRFHRPACILTFAVIAGFSFLSKAQVGIWQNTETLFEAILNHLGDHPYRSDILWRKGRYLYEIGNYIEARSELATALEMDPSNTKAMEYLADVEYDSGNTQVAINLFKRILTINPDNPFIHAKLAYIYNQSNQPDKAAYHLRAASEPAHGTDDE